MGLSVADGVNRILKNVKVVVPLKYVSSFFKSLEMRLIICKIHLEIYWTKNCVMSNISGVTIFHITSTKLYVPIAPLTSKNIAALRKQLDQGFKRSIYWNEFKTKIETKQANN